MAGHSKWAYIKHRPRLRVIGAEVTMLASTEVALTADEAEKLLRLVENLENLENLEDLDDVQNVYSNASISNAVMAQLSGD